MTTALIYTRASLDRTGEGASVERQESACRGLAQARGWDVLRVESDNSISAYGEKDRPAWDRVLASIGDREVDVVIAWHMDRMTRSMLDLETLILRTEKSGVAFATATGDIDLTTDTGRMVARILTAVARAEVERKGARQKLANEARAVKGLPFTGGPRRFGYTQDGLALVPDEAAAIREAARSVLDDGTALAEVVRRWQAAGFTSGRSHNQRGHWSTNGVKDVLTSPRYAGRSTYKGEDVGESVSPVIIDYPTHLALVVHLGDPGRTVGKLKAGAVPTTLLTSIARCDVCGGTISGASSRGRLTYTCRTNHCVSLPRDPVDDYVSTFVVAVLSVPDSLATLAGDSPDADAARSELDEVESRLSQLAQAFASGLITMHQMSTATATLRARQEAAQRSLAASVAVADVLPFYAVDGDTATAWGAASLAQRRRMVGGLFDVRLRPLGTSRRRDSTFDPEERVVIARRGDV